MWLKTSVLLMYMFLLVLTSFREYRMVYSVGTARLPHMESSMKSEQ